MFTLDDFVYILLEEELTEVELFDFKSQGVVFHGMASDIPVEYMDCTVESIDPIGEYGTKNYITLNINTEE